MYKFVKLKLSKINGKKIKPLEYSWMLVLDNIETLDDYMENVQGGIIREGLTNLMLKKYDYHCTNSWELAVEIATKSKGTSFLKESINLEDKVYQNRIYTILKYGKMYVNVNGGGFPHCKDLEIVDEIEKANLIWPDYSKKDIKIIRWPKGKHYYAKIGNIDVIDEKGEQKWNTYEKAKKEANKYFDEI